MISDKSVEKLLGKLSRDIAQRTPGTGDFYSHRRTRIVPPKRTRSASELPGPSQYCSGS